MNDHANAACTCDQQTAFLPVMSFVQAQVLQAVFEPEQALRCGTLFPEIYKPFKGGCRHG